MPESSTTKPRVGWIGLGSMGLPMAQRLCAAGWPLTVWARREQAARPVLELGATWAPDVGTLARSCTRVVTILRGTEDVREVHEALMGALAAGSLVVDMTTAAPAVAPPLADALRARGVAWIDSPVTGGVAGARKGTLTLFVGGDEQALEACRPLLQQLGRRLVPCGGPGSGYRMKLINQVVMAGALLGVAEGAAMARASGLAGSEVREALGDGTASGWMFNAYAERMTDGGGEVGFTLAMLRKDLRLAREAAADLGLHGSILLQHALSVVERACDRQGAQAGVQSIAWLDRGTTPALE